MIEYVPAGHAWQTSELVAPETPEYRPVPHPSQSQGLSSSPVPNVPGLHSRHCGKKDRGVNLSHQKNMQAILEQGRFLQHPTQPASNLKKYRTVYVPVHKVRYGTLEV